VRPKQSDYLTWSKRRSGARYNLARSGAPRFPLADLSPSLDDLLATDPHEDGWPPLVDRIAARYGEPLHHAARLGRDHVLHLHRFHDQQRLTGGDELASAHVDRDDRALQRCAHRDQPVGQGLRFDERIRRGGGRLAVVEHRERIARVDPRTRERGPGSRCGFAGDCGDDDSRRGDCHHADSRDDASH